MSYKHVLYVDTAAYSDFSKTCSLLSDDMLPNCNPHVGDIIQVQLRNQNTKDISVRPYLIKIIDIKLLNNENEITKTLFTEPIKIRDYLQVLESLLSNGNQWEEANTETIRLINEIISEHNDIRLFSYSELKKLLLPENLRSCEKIYAIDNLWVKYSSGKFGFSVQKDIYTREGGEIKDNPFEPKIWNNFLQKIGWASLTTGFTLLQPEFKLSDDTTKKGHLPYWYKWSQEELREDLRHSEESILAEYLGFLALFSIVG